MDLRLVSDCNSVVLQIAAQVLYRKTIHACFERTDGVHAKIAVYDAPGLYLDSVSALNCLSARPQKFIPILLEHHVQGLMYKTRKHKFSLAILSLGTPVCQRLQQAMAAALKPVDDTPDFGFLTQR